jgi:hypothetical protein
MKDFLRNRIDAFESRRDRRDQEFADTVIGHLDALSDRKTLRIYSAALAVVNALIWLTVILFPGDVAAALEKADNASNKIPLTVIAIIFGLGMWLAYSAFRLRYPDIEDRDLDESVLASFSYSQKDTKRWWVWVLSVAFGVVNVLALCGADVYLSHGY